MGLACIAIMIKTGSFDNAIQEFSLGYPLWYISHYTMLYKYGKRTRNFWDAFIFILSKFSIF